MLYDGNVPPYSAANAVFNTATYGATGPCSTVVSGPNGQCSFAVLDAAGKTLFQAPTPLPAPPATITGGHAAQPCMQHSLAYANRAYSCATPGCECLRQCGALGTGRTLLHACMAVAGPQGRWHAGCAAVTSRRLLCAC